jgi:RNA polymerase sigma factor (sigma-70 family)
MPRTAIPLIHRALTRSVLTQASDAELLRRFAQNRDSDAFNELIQRHAGVVWSVCRRTCNDPSLAEDAFQATFIALARGASSVRHPDRLAGWLYGVARRTANKMRVAQRPQSNPIPDQATHDPAPVETVSGKEFMEAVEEEVARLPEKYRSAVLMCWFEDRSLEEVAGRLGVTKDTLWGRLKQAREQLRKRLSAKGYGLSTVFGAGVLFSERVEAGLVKRVTAEAVNIPAHTSTFVPKLVFGLLLAATSIGIASFIATDTPQEIAKKEPTPKADEVAISDGFPMPPGALQRFGNRQLRHPEWTSDMVVSPDGKYFVTAGNQSVIIWDTQTLTAKRVVNVQLNYNAKASRLHFLPDGKSILISIHDEPKPIGAGFGGGGAGIGARPVVKYEHAHVYDIETGKKKFAITGDYSYHNSSWLAANKKEIVTFSTSGDERKLRFSDASTGEEIKVLDGPPTSLGVWVSGDGETIAYLVAKVGGLVVRPTRANKELYSIPNTESIFNALSHDGKLLVTIEQQTVRVIDLVAQKERFSFKHPNETPNAPMVISKDNKTLYFGSENGFLYRWDLEKNEEIKGLDRHSLWTLTSLALNPDESTLYSLGNDKVVRRWDLKTNKPLPTPDGYTTIVQMLPSVDSKSLFVGDHGGWIHRWDLATGKRVQSYLKEASGGVNCLAQSNDGKWLAVGGTLQDVRIWNLTTGEKARALPLADPQDIYGGDQVQQVGFSPDGNTVYSTSPKTGLTAWERETGKKLWQASGAGPLLAFDPKGRWIVSSAYYKHPIPPWEILDPATGKVLGKVEVPNDPDLERLANAHAVYPPYTTSFCVLPDGSRVLSAHGDGTIREWNTETWKEVRRWHTTKTGTTRLACSPDGQWLAIANGRRVALWDYASGKELLVRNGHDAEITQVAFTPDGRGLLTNADLAPILWDLTPTDLPKLDAKPDELFALLASDDAAKVYRLQWALIREPDAVVKLLAERIKPTEWGVERQQFDQWIAYLDNPRFAVREKALKDLTDADTKVPLVWLRTSLKETKSEEVNMRLTRLLTEREKKPDRIGLRLARLIQVLELANTPATRTVLTEWANSTANTPPTILAKAALLRLERK